MSDGKEDVNDVTTKTQQQREARYRRQLAKCGFRSWKRANCRRGELIASDVASLELDELQHLCDLYLIWKTNDERGRSVRRLDRLLKQLGSEHRE